MPVCAGILFTEITPGACVTFFLNMREKDMLAFKTTLLSQMSSGEIFQSAFFLPANTQACSVWKRITKEFLNASESACLRSLFA